MNSTFEYDKSLDILHDVGESIFIVDTNQNIVWMNHFAEQLIDSLAPHLHIQNHKDILGVNIARFHRNPEYQRNILKNGPFPHCAKITLLDYTASIVVTKFKDGNDEVKGYLLVWKDVTKLEQQRQADRELIDQLSTPILPTVIQEALLVPLIGEITKERTEKLECKLSKKGVEQHIEFVIFDFTGVTSVIDEAVATQMDKTVKSVSLLGAKSLYVGFSPESVLAIVHSGVDLRVKTFRTFGQAMQYAMNKKGYKILRE